MIKAICCATLYMMKFFCSIIYTSVKLIINAVSNLINKNKQINTYNYDDFFSEENTITKENELKKKETEKIYSPLKTGTEKTIDATEYSELIAKQEQEQKHNQTIIDGFNSLLAIVDHETTNEILEYLLELEDLKKYYENTPENKKHLLGDIEIIKNTQIEYALNKKFRKIYNSKKEYDLCLAFVDEINYCKERFPEYEYIFNAMLIKVKNRLKDLNNMNYKGIRKVQKRTNNSPL